MKNIATVLFFFMCIATASSQQFLWASDSTYNTKYIPHNKVVSEVLKFYEYFDYYLDGTGYTKESFFDFFLTMLPDTTGLKDFFNIFERIDTMTVFAWRMPSEKGSIILVMSIDKNNINLISFFNFYDIYAINTDDHKKDKFKSWFKSLLN